MKKLTRRRKRQMKQIAVLTMASGIVAIAVLSMVFTIGSFVYHRYFSKDDTLNYDNISIKEPEITKLLLTPNVNSRPGKKLKKVNGIVIHYTANPGTDAQANRNYFEGRKDEADASENKVSSHFIVGLDGEIVQCIPLEEIAYASNDRNRDTVSIECCHPDETGKFTAETYRAVISLCAWLCDRYELRKDEIIRHYDVTGKLCPLYYVKHEEAWEELKASIWNRLRENEYNAESK